MDANELLNKKWEVGKVKNQPSRFMMVCRVLYKRGYSTSLQRCVSLEEAQYVLVEIYEGVCRNHSGGRALAEKMVKVGYHWAHALKDIEEFVQKCPKWQLYAPLLHCPLEELKPIMSPWPFM